MVQFAGYVADAAAAVAGNPALSVFLLVAALLLYADLRRRLPVVGIPTKKMGRSWPVLGDLPTVVPYAKAGKITDWARKAAEMNDFNTFAAWGPFVSEVTIASPENMRHMFNTHFQSYNLPVIRSDAFGEALGGGIFNSDGDRWKEQRAFASHLFSASMLKRRMTAVFAANAAKVKAILDEKKPGEVFDIQSLLYGYTFDAICEIAFGVKVDSLSGVQKDVEFQKAFDHVQARSSMRFYDVLWKLKRALGVGPEREFSEAVKVVDGFIDDIMRTRKSRTEEVGEDESADLLSMYERHCADTGEKPSRDDYRDLIMSFMIAGRDTTASVLTWCFWELSHDRGAREKVEDDIRQNADPDTMHWTQAVFQEVLRLHPSVPLDGKECVKDDVLPDGTRIKKGMVVNFHPCVITRNPKIFPDPNTFKPSRWMEADGRCRKYDEYMYPCFNAGPRICLGRHMAALESKMLLSEIMSSYRVDVVEGFEPVLAHTVVLMTKNGMQVTLTPRE